MTIPRKLPASNPLSVEWNKMVDCLRSMTVSVSTGTHTKTSHGTAIHARRHIQRGSVVYVPICYENGAGAGTKQYLPVLAMGDAVDEADIPPEANVIDPSV
jgi:hypothetical protein